MDRGAWRATVRGIAKSWPQLSAVHILYKYSYQGINSIISLFSLHVYFLER